MDLSLWGVPSALHVTAETACTCSQVGDAASQASYIGVCSAQSGRCEEKEDESLE